MVRALFVVMVIAIIFTLEYAYSKAVNRDKKTDQGNENQLQEALKTALRLSSFALISAAISLAALKVLSFL